MPDRQPEARPENPPDPHQARLFELLTVCAAFLRVASPTVHDELRTFLTARGYHPIAGPPAFLDALEFTVTRPAGITTEGLTNEE
jgi:hypothetical protein